MRGNLEGFMHCLPDIAPIVVGLFALGVVLYACSILATGVGDRRIKRRLMVHAMQESVSETDVALFRAGFCRNEEVPVRQDQRVQHKGCDVLADAQRLSPQDEPRPEVQVRSSSGLVWLFHIVAGRYHQHVL